MFIGIFKCFALLTIFCSLVWAQEPKTPEEYLQQKDELVGSTFQVVDQKIEPAQLADLLQQVYGTCGTSSSRPHRSKRFPFG